MTDDKFLNEIAKLWVELGGDSEGVTYCWKELLIKIKELEKKESNEM